MKKQEFRKVRRGLGISGKTLNFKHLNFKCLKTLNIQIIGMPEGEENKQEIEKLFENIMKENFPNLAKEIDIQV